jgi:divalent metal cation (Fe/Co/Zn/Cd) transporter
VSDTPREDLLPRGLFLEYMTVGWNVVEGVVAISAAVVAGSVALLGLGIDSFIECVSGGILIWRLRSETTGIDERAIERLEHRAERLVAISFVLLASYVAIDASFALWNQRRPDASTVGIALTSLSLLVMGWLAPAKQRTARVLGSEPWLRMLCRRGRACGSRRSCSSASVPTRCSVGGGPTRLRRSGSVCS